MTREWLTAVPRARRTMDYPHPQLEKRRVGNMRRKRALGIVCLPSPSLDTFTWILCLSDPSRACLGDSRPRRNHHRPLRASAPVMVFLSCFPEPFKGKPRLRGSHRLSNLHPLCSHLGLSGRVTAETCADGLARMYWPGRLSFHTLPNVEGAFSSTEPTIGGPLSHGFHSYPFTGSTHHK